MPAVIKRWLQKWLYKPVLWLSHRFSSRPDARRIAHALDALYDKLVTGTGKTGPVLPLQAGSRYIVFSDQHKGTRNGSDDFRRAEPNYLAALSYYYDNGFTLINLGDCEELWENMVEPVRKKNTANFEAEKKFADRDAFIKIFGNHDIYWHNDPLAFVTLYRIYGRKLPVYEGAIIQREQWNGGPLRILLTHGHQGDGQSDANPFSAWFISNIWAPLQSFLDINFNTPAYDSSLKSLHNQMMYEWSRSKKNLLLVTGHTHQPVFCSMTRLESLYLQLEEAKLKNDTEEILQLQERIRKAWKEDPPESIKSFRFDPSYFNTGCCCFDDGDITGLEISFDRLCLVKWETENGRPQRVELDSVGFDDLSRRFHQLADSTTAPTGISS